MFPVMDSVLPLFLVLLVGLALGALLGWLIGSRSAAAGREVTQSLRLQLDGVVEEREAARRRSEEMQAADAASRVRISALEADAANFDKQQKALIEAKDTLTAQFQEIAGRLLDAAKGDLLKRADERFSQAGESTEAKLKALLAPVETTLKRYEDNLSRVEKEREGSYRELNKAVSDLAQGNDVVRRETQRLANVMRSSPKARGRWGEEQLKTILESAGLSENVDFQLQASVSDGERQLRPDCVINLPGGRCIVVDVKCPLVAFEQAYDEEDEARRAALLLDHANAIKAYANDLGRKSYWRQFDRSPDFVILFVPGEHFLSAAAERAPDLIETAYRNGVIVASTINMLALAKVMAGMWRQEALAEQAYAIHELGKDLYDRLMAMGAHVNRLGKNLSTASEAYNSFVGSLETKVLTQAKRFKDLKVETGGKDVESPPLVEFSPRPLVKVPLETDTGEREVDGTA